MPELAADSSEYTVLVRSRSGARVRRGYYMDVTDFPDGLGGQVQVRISTRWEDLGLDYPLPRELWMAVRARADSVDAANPGSKMASEGSDWLTNPQTQIRWGEDYIQGKYGSPCQAWAYWQTHHNY